MKQITKKQELVATHHLLPLVFYLQEKRVKVHLNRNGTQFPVLKNGLRFEKCYNQGLEQN